MTKEELREHCNNYTVRYHDLDVGKEQVVEVCSVTDSKGNHCPREVVTYINRDGKSLPLCRKCYNNVMKGAYEC